MLLVLVLIIASYMVVGTFISRAVYATQLDTYNTPRKIPVWQALKEMKHGSTCYQHPKGRYYAPERNCDCGLQSKWEQLQKKDADEVVSVDNIAKPPTNPYLVMTLWPVLGYHKFLTSGTVRKEKKYDPELVARLERELQMAN